jgi:SHS family lactate transporter-like MFS transporter
VLPALLLVYNPLFVKEPAVWLENRRLQRTQKREVRLPLLSISSRPCSAIRSPPAVG